MNYELGEEVGLNESKFLSEQVNYDQEPTEEEIIEKAEELGIDDYGMAKEALLKQLDPQWRPYINRHGRVFYINLDEKKGYVDHPIDMYYRIHYALKNKKKIPSFQQFSLDQITEDPRIILKQINNFKVNQSLNIVYEESQEQSVKKNTKRSEEDESLQLPGIEQKYNLAMENQVLAFRDLLQEQIKNQLKEYRREQQKEYAIRQKRYDDKMKKLKSQRLSQITSEFQKEWEIKNQLSFEKSVETSKQQFQQKLIRFQDALNKEQSMIKQINQTKDFNFEYKVLYKEKVRNQKQKYKNQILTKSQIGYQNKVNEILQTAKHDFEIQLKAKTENRMNLNQIFTRNLKEFNRFEQRPKRKRLSIFQSQVMKESNEEKIEKLNEQLNCSQKIWTNNYGNTIDSFDLKSKPSLSLRLFKRIL